MCLSLNFAAPCDLSAQSCSKPLWPWRNAIPYSIKTALGGALFLLASGQSAGCRAESIVFLCNFTTDHAANFEVNNNRALVDGQVVSNNVEINDRFIVWTPSVKDFPQKLRLNRATGEVVNENGFGVFPAGRCMGAETPKQ